MVTHDADRSSAGRARPPARGLRHPVMLAALVALMLTQLAWAQRTAAEAGLEYVLAAARRRNGSTGLSRCRAASANAQRLAGG